MGSLARPPMKSGLMKLSTVLTTSAPQSAMPIAAPDVAGDERGRSPSPPQTNAGPASGRNDAEPGEEAEEER